MAVASTQATKGDLSFGAVAAEACAAAATSLPKEWVELQPKIALEVEAASTSPKNVANLGRLRLRDPEGLLFSNSAFMTMMTKRTLDEAPTIRAKAGGEAGNGMGHGVINAPCAKFDPDLIHHRKHFSNGLANPEMCWYCCN